MTRLLLEELAEGAIAVSSVRGGPILILEWTEARELERSLRHRRLEQQSTLRDGQRRRAVTPALETGTDGCEARPGNRSHAGRH